VGYLAPQCGRSCHDPSISAVPGDFIAPNHGSWVRIRSYAGSNPAFPANYIDTFNRSQRSPSIAVLAPCRRDVENRGQRRPKSASRQLPLLGSGRGLGDSAPARAIESASPAGSTSSRRPANANVAGPPTARSRCHRPLSPSHEHDDFCLETLTTDSTHNAGRRPGSS